jgi:parvulin-like peptidyl-prolyl isomerase
MLVGLLLTTAAWGQPADQPSSGAVAARVDGNPIRISELQEQFTSLAGKRTLNTAQVQRLQSAILERVIQRHLVLAYLQRTEQAASKADVDLAIEQLAAQLRLQQKTIADYVAEEKIDDQQLIMRLNWQLSWSRFQKRYLTDNNLERFFDQHSDEFDGTRRRVAHILLKTTEETSASELLKLKARQQLLREQISSGDISFAEAARQHSESPTSAKGGDIGLISWQGPMPADFTRTAFTLSVGELSQPIVTRFGVHVLTCTEVKKGQGTWQDAQQELRDAVIRYLFDWAAGEQREHSRIKYTGNWPEK